MTINRHNDHHAGRHADHPSGHRAVSHKAKGSSGVLGLALKLAFGAAAIAGAVFIFKPAEQEVAPPFERLVEQMNSAVDGAALPTHAFGGALKVEKTGDGITVIAEAVPQKICLNAAWVLASSGTVAINGRIPARISATGLAELCSRAGEEATISWTPTKK